MVGVVRTVPVSLDHYHGLREAGDPDTHAYLVANFNLLFAEAVERFALFGWGAMGLGLVTALVALGSWLRLRRRLPLPWLWLVPLLVFIPYALIKGAVIFELIRQAPELPQMWSLYFKYWTPLKMIRTPVSGLALTAGVMVVVAWYRGRRPRPTRYG